MSLELTEMAGKEAGPLIDTLKPIYHRAYDEPPYHYTEKDADEFVERWQATLERANFTLVLGHVADELVGFSYGYTFPTHLWWRGAQTEPPTEVAAATKFAVIELVVDRPYRGSGYSRPLMDALLVNRSEDFGVLLAKPGAQAHAMYQRWGWRKVGVVQSYPHWPVDDAFVMDLASTR